MDNNTPIQAIIVSHTHWDRAWYLPFEEFRFKLVYMIDRIISLLSKDENFKCFVLDGQTILIEDYLEIKPEKKAELKSLIKSGRLLIGPWYVLPDLFLASGESTIRNLQIGHSMTKRFGGKMDVGYVPDPFGHIAQLPQILNGFDISTFIFMRGMPNEVLEKNSLLFNWVAPNGSSVLAYYTKDGYLNAANLGYEKEIGRFDFVKPSIEKATTRVHKTTKSLTEFHPNNLILLNNGMDHMPEQPELPDLINELNVSNPQMAITQGTFGDFMDAAKSLDTEVNYTGNLLGNPHHPILLSVYSTRTYLKKLNQEAQGILEKIAEPLSLISSDLTNTEVPLSFLAHSWKTLLKNHPHDDICGCSTDAVHKDNETRFRQVMEICESICTESLENLQKSGFKPAPDTGNNNRSQEVFVFNPHPFSHSCWIETDIIFPNLLGEEEEILEEYELKAFDASGEELCLEVLETEAPYLKAEFIQFTWGRLYKLRINLNIPASGYHLIRIEESKKIAQAKMPTLLSDSTENDRYKISWDDNTIKVLDIETGVSFSDFLKFEFVQDDGDSYSFSRASDAFYSTLQKVSTGNYQQCIIADFLLKVPKGLSSTKTVEIPVQVHIDYSHAEDLRLKVSYENKASNGRLRILLPLGFYSTMSYSDGHFMVYENPRLSELDASSHKQVYDQYPGELNYPTHFMGDFCYSIGDKFNTWIATKGLNEYELVDIKESTFVAITLHRAIGYLSVSNGSIRRPHAGPKISVPDAQCLRSFSWELAWGTTNSNKFEISKKAHSFSYPPFVRELPEFQGEPIKGELPRVSSFLNIPDKRIKLSCLKRADKSSDFILRVYNLSSEQLTSEIEVGISCSSFCVTDFYEQWNEHDELSVENGKLKIMLQPHQILTYRLRK